jgi:hypothetical protein
MKKLVLVALLIATPALAQPAPPATTGAQFCGQMTGNMSMQIATMYDQLNAKDAEIMALKKQLEEAKAAKGGN